MVYVFSMTPPPLSQIRLHEWTPIKVQFISPLAQRRCCSKRREILQGEIPTNGYSLHTWALMLDLVAATWMRMNENRDVKSFLISRLNQALGLRKVLVSHWSAPPSQKGWRGCSEVPLIYLLGKKEVGRKWLNFRPLTKIFAD